MGVDFYICHYCRETFADCGPYERCETCGRHWCAEEYDDCARKEGLIKSEEPDDYGTYDSSCNFCRNETAEDGDILEYLLTKFGLTRDQAEKECLNARN